MSLHAIILTTWHVFWRSNGQWVSLTASMVQFEERKVIVLQPWSDHLLTAVVSRKGWLSAYRGRARFVVHCKAEAVQAFSLTVYTNPERKRSVCRWVNANNHLFLQ